MEGEHFGKVVINTKQQNCQGQRSQKPISGGEQFKTKVRRGEVQSNVLKMYPEELKRPMKTTMRR